MVVLQHTERLHFNMKAFFLVILSQLIVHSNVNSQSTKKYVEEFESWKTQREANLKSEKGWLNLAGLFWLKEGVNSIGTQSTSDVQLPAGKAQDEIGKLMLNHERVTILSTKEDSISIDSEWINGSKVIYDEVQNIELTLNHRNLRFFIIKRGSRIGVRLRDLNSENVKEFTTIPRFQYDTTYRVKANVLIPSTPQYVNIVDVLGNTTPTPIGAILKFQLLGKSYELIATQEVRSLFVVFSDNTSGSTTYGAGRFLYVDFPLNANEVILDFNKAYNPPCAFTHFATCPLPLKENSLDLEIVAGEKLYKSH